MADAPEKKVGHRADLADKTIVNYFQVVKTVIASAVSSEGEQLYPRNWNFHFIGFRS